MTFIQIDAVTSDRLLIAIWRMFDWCWGTLHPKWICIEILALLTTRKIGLNVSEVILASIVVFLSAAWFFGISTALYSIVTYFPAKSLDYVTNGIEHYTSYT
jgi:hypothetical protein